MTIAARQDHPVFSPGMLWRDERYRSVIIQTITLMAVMLGFAWLVSNTVQNLSALGKDFNFSFLWQPAGYDINQRLIPYDNQDSNARAALVGIMNTLLIAFLGCVAATILGIIAGVLRLSKNYLVARIMTVYVEGFRNVPLLLWILLVMAVVNENLPSPRAFRGEDGIDAGAAVLTNRGFYIPAPVYESGSTIVVIVTLLSIAAAYLFRRWSRRYQEATGFELPPLPGAVVIALSAAVAAIGGVAVAWLVLQLLSFTVLSPETTGGIAVAAVIAVAASIAIGRWAASALVSSIIIVTLVVPSVLVYVLAGQPIGLEYPELRGFNFQGGIYLRDSLIALWLALSLYTGAFIAEIVRAGILSVSKGQTEAAYALGLRPNKTMQLIILPQALRVIVPPLISQFLNLTKNSSLAIAVGYMDATGTLGGITLNQTGREIESIVLLMAFYLVVSLTISSVMNAYNARVKLVER